MTAVMLVDARSGATLGAVRATDDGMDFTGSAESLFRSRQRLTGWDDDRVFDALAAGWSNSYVTTEVDEATLDALNRAEGPHEDDEILRALSGNRYKLRSYWTQGKGLKRWIKSRHPWTTLYRLLRRHVGSARAKRLASAWLHRVTGLYAGSDAHRLLHGGKIRGRVVGPG